MPPKPVPTGPLNIPESDQLVRVSIIDTTSRLGKIPTKLFFEPHFEKSQYFSGPAYAFLIEHAPTNTKLLFDLGVRKDTENLAPKVRELTASWDVDVQKDVSDILRDQGVDPASVQSIIWSHRHFDHTGDPARFPASTDLVVGPGFRDKVGAGYPADPDSTVTSSAWEGGRRLVELEFGTHERALRIGNYCAIDWFGDGSFYLLQTPGHTNDHMSGFARTKRAADSTTGKDEFILMGGDVAHDSGEFRPNKFEPIPERIEPDPRQRLRAGGVCPGEYFAKFNKLHEGDAKWKEPFANPVKSLPDDWDEAVSSLDELQRFDSQDNIFVVFAHDNELLEVLQYYPIDASEWRSQGWKNQGKWRFLNNFVE